MTTKKILLVAGSAALLANFTFGQEAQPPQQDPPPPPQAPVEQPAPPPTPQNGGWRKFGSPQQAGNQAPNGTPQYGDPQQAPPPGYYPPPQGQYPAQQGQYPPQQGQYLPPQGQYPPQQGQYPPQQGQQPNYAAYPPMAPLPAKMTLPAGTWVKIHVDHVLSSNHNKDGDTFTGTLAQPVIVNGFVIAHRGQNITGHVLHATKAGRVKGTSELSLEITEVAIADGQQLPLKTSLVEYHGPTSRGNDAFAIGSTTVLGAAIGAAVNGGVGAGVGAAAGLVASTVGVLVTRGHPTVIFPESLLTFKTAEPVGFSTEHSSYAFQPAGPQDYTPAMQTRTAIRPGYGPYPYRPYGYGYPYAYGYPYYGGYPWFGTGIYIRGGRRW